MQTSSKPLLNQVLPMPLCPRDLRDNHLGGTEVLKLQQDQSLLICSNTALGMSRSFTRPPRPLILQYIALYKGCQMPTRWKLKRIRAEVVTEILKEKKKSGPGLTFRPPEVEYVCSDCEKASRKPIPPSGKGWGSLAEETSHSLLLIYRGADKTRSHDT